MPTIELKNCRSCLNTPTTKVPRVSGLCMWVWVIVVVLFVDLVIFLVFFRIRKQILQKDIARNLRRGGQRGYFFYVLIFLSELVVVLVLFWGEKEEP